jgi:antitoxin (DNA-binding transcriptional repressor) of toxin-antitoxin stability system
MAQFVASAKAGEVVWLSEGGEPVGAIAPRDVVEAGLRALGRA